MTSACSRPELETAPESVRWACVVNLPCRVSPRVAYTGLDCAVSCNRWLALGHPRSQKVASTFGRIHSVPSITITHLHNIFAEDLLPVPCTACLVCLGVRRVSGSWNQDMEPTLKQTSNNQPLGQLANPLLPSQLLLPPICLLRISVRSHSLPIHHLSFFA